MAAVATRLASLSGFDPALDALRLEAAASGFLFLDRLVSEWRSGTNRFEQPGEVLVGAYVNDVLAGVGGLNCDPYEPNASIGRVRHLYVAASFRRQGIGSDLLEAIIGHASNFYQAVRLRTDTKTAGEFYLRHGFSAVDHIWATHVKQMKAGRAPSIQAAVGHNLARPSLSS